MLDAVGDRPATLIPGVGPRTAERLAQLGVRTVAELAAMDPAALERAFGPRLGRELRDRAHGHDDRPVVTERERKSESRETTFASDVSDRAMLAGTLDRLADSVCRGLAEGGYAGRTVTLKIRLRPFRTHTRSRTIEEPTRDPERVRSVARQLLADFELDAPVRLLGVGVAGLVRKAEDAASKPEAASAPQSPDARRVRQSLRAPEAEVPAGALGAAATLPVAPAGVEVHEQPVPHRRVQLRHPDAPIPALSRLELDVEPFRMRRGSRSRACSAARARRAAASAPCETRFAASSAGGRRPSA